MALTMNEKKSVGKEWSKQYRKASKKRKSEILSEFIGITGYNRCYAARKLLDCAARHTQKAPQTNKKKRGRKQVYGEWLLEPLRIIWESFDYACAKRVHAGMEDMLGGNAPLQRVMVYCGRNRATGEDVSFNHRTVAAPCEETDDHSWPLGDQTRYVAQVTDPRQAGRRMG